MSQTALVHQETEHKLPSNSHSRPLWRRTAALAASLLTDNSKKETKAARQQARKDLEDENKALPAKIQQVRGG